jgi:hypothetical protein
MERVYENLLNFPLVQVGYASKICLIADSRILKITSKEEKMLYGFLGLTKAFSSGTLDYGKIEKIKYCVV